VAAARAEHRERTETGRSRDSFESDDGLQARCALLYDELAARDWLAPWHVVDGTLPQDMAVLAKTLLR
jgi:dTMP kinase